MLVGDDLVADGAAQSWPFADGLGGEEWIEDSLAIALWNTRPVIANQKHDAIALQFRFDRNLGRDHRIRFALRCGMVREPIAGI